MYRILIALITFNFIFQLGLNAQSAIAFADTIPYEIVVEKIIITAHVEGKPTKFIFDTGGRNFIVRDSLSTHNVRIISQETVADVNSLASNLPKGIVSSLRIGKHYSMKNAPMLVMPNNNFYRLLNVAGALGGEAFSHVTVTFHPKEKYITLSYPYRPKGVSRKDGIQMVMGNNFHSVVPVNIGSSTINALFDTGMTGFMHIVNSDYAKLKDREKIDIQAQGSGVFHIGIGGIKDAKQEEIAKLDIATMKIGNKQFANIGTLRQSRSHSIIGLELLDYGKVMLDYPRGLFYFFPFDDDVADMSTKTKIWNVKILPIEYHFEVSATIGDLDVEIGERVWNINGRGLEDVKPSEIDINNILNSIESDTAYILVGKEEKSLKKIMIKKI